MPSQTKPFRLRRATTERPRPWQRAVGVAAALAVVAGATSLATQRATADSVTPWPELNDPPHAKVEWVAEHLRVNGLPSKIEHFDAEVSPAEVLAFYRAMWQRPDGPAPRETAHDGWQTLATLHGPFQMVVQVRPKEPQGSEGLISVANLGEFQRDYVPHDLPSLDHATVIQVTESVDGARQSAHVTLVSDAGLDANVRRYADAWAHRGWTLTQAHDAPGADGVAMHYATFSRGSDTLDTSYVWQPRDRRTYMTVNLVSAAAPKDWR